MPSARTWLETNVAFGIGAAVEPQSAGGFVVGLGRAGVDAGEIDFDLRTGGLGPGRIELHLRDEALEAALHRHAHLAVFEADAALLRQHGAVFHGMRNRHSQRCKQGEDDRSQVHVRSFPPSPCAAGRAGVR